MSTRKPEPITSRDAPGWEWTETELAWIAKRDAQWAAWGYSLAPLTPASEDDYIPFSLKLAAMACVALAGWLAGLTWALLQ